MPRARFSAYHAGQGTQEIFYADDNVLTISLHADPREEYPTYQGFEHEYGIDNGYGYNLNYIVAKGTDIYGYLKILYRALDNIKLFDPDYLVIAFGADTYAEDPDCSHGLGFKLQIHDYAVIAAAIKTLGLPILVTQEGGYNLDAVDSIVYNFLTNLV